MFNNTTFNENTFNNILEVQDSNSDESGDYEAVFGGINLNTGYLKIKDIQGLNNAPSRAIDYEDRSRDNGRIKIGDYEREKFVYIIGRIKAPDYSYIPEILDEVKGALTQKDQDLHITADGRQYYFKNANCINPNEMLEGQVNTKRERCPFLFEFKMTDPPYSMSESYDAFESIYAQTELEFNEYYNNQGNAETFTIFNIYINSVDTFTDLVITNENNGKSITITEPLEAGDRIIIDGEKQKVIKRQSGIDTEIDFENEFVTMEMGDNQINFNFNCSAVNVDIHAKTRFYRK